MDNETNRDIDKARSEKAEHILKMWETLQPFKEVYDVPHLPKPITNAQYEKLYQCGAIRKEELVDGKTYLGRCRNADRAVWHKKFNVFTYVRHKFGNIFDEQINHLADDNGFDLFVPIKRLD